jgi:hypothetical protein
MNDKIAWVAAATGIMGAFLVASNVSQTLGFIGYLLFTTSSVGWLYFAYKTKQQHLLMTNLVFFMINMIGIVRWS